VKAARQFVAHWVSIVVIALTNVGLRLVIVGFAWTTLGCAPGAIQVAPADSTTFRRMIEADVAANALRTAQLLEQTLRGDSSSDVGVLDHDKLPEAYSPDGNGRFGASNYHVAYAARRILREFYAAAHPTHRRLENNNMETVVDKAGGNLWTLNKFEKDRQLDIVDVDGRFVFEIVPAGQPHREAGKKKLDWILAVLNKTMLGVPTFERGMGYEGEVGVRFAEGAPAWKLAWTNPEPGIIEYRWQVLSPSDSSNEAHGQAYLDDRWHDPTPFEMVRFARASQEVVERLIQAREELGQTRAAVTMPILPGKTRADYLRSLVWWSAHDEGIARLLPVMRKPPPPAPTRPDPRVLAQTTGGGSSGGGSGPRMHPGATEPDKIVVPPHPSAPEAYTLDGKFGNMPWQFFLGYSAHRAIAWRYRALHQGFGEVVFDNFISVATIVDRVGGDKALLDWSDADLRPDIAHTSSRKPEQFVFEIKPEGKLHFTKGKEKLALYIGALNVGVSRTPKVFVPGPNDSGELWIMFKGGELVWRLTWKTTAPGLLQYKWSKPDTKAEKDRQKREEAWRQAIEEGRWTDISKQEAEDNAEELFETIEGMVLGRDVVGLFRDAVTLAIDGVGAAAEVILSARLWNHIDTAPRLVPIVRVAPPVKPPPMKPPTMSTKPPPPVNARPLGSDKRMTPKTTRSPDPGKTPTNDSPN